MVSVRESVEHRFSLPGGGNVISEDLRHAVGHRIMTESDLRRGLDRVGDDSASPSAASASSISRVATLRVRLPSTSSPFDRTVMSLASDSRSEFSFSRSSASLVTSVRTATSIASSAPSSSPPSEISCSSSSTDRVRFPVSALHFSCQDDGVRCMIGDQSVDEVGDRARVVFDDLVDAAPDLVV